MHLAKTAPKKLMSHSGELKPMMVTVENSGRFKAKRDLANFMHSL